MSRAGPMLLDGAKAKSIGQSSAAVDSGAIIDLVGQAAVGFGLVILWALAHPFAGIDGDATIYMGRVLADLDPNGVGRDMMFAQDGQSSFSIFRVLAPRLVGLVGLSTSVALLTILNLLVWFVAVVVLARTLAEGKALAFVLAAVCVLPRIYAPWHLLTAGESIPVPRPLAEACVLFALAALCREKYLFALASLVGAACFHPIMAAPGFGVLIVVMSLEDRRWIVAAIVAAAAVVAAAACGAPLAARALVMIDPLWRSVLVERTPYLFLHLWPIEGFARAAVQMATVVIASAFLPTAPRRVVLAAVVVAILGCAIAVTFGDGLGDLLVLQAQPWRALWVPAVLALVAGGLCVWHLPGRGASGQVTLAALVIAWVSIDSAAVALVAAAVALGIWLAASYRPLAIGRSTVLAAWAVAIVFCVLSNWASIQVLAVDLARRPAELSSSWAMAWPLGLPIAPVLLALSAWRAWPRSPAIATGLVAVAVLGATCLATFWDIRTPARRDLDAASPNRTLVRALQTRRGDILWLGGDEVWAWAGRGNWGGLTQGAGIVFSRDLSMRWRLRTQAMLDHGLTGRGTLAPWDPVPASRTPLLDPTALGDFCRRPDAPAWVVAAVEADAAPPLAGALFWAAPARGWAFTVNDGDLHWTPRDRFALIPCAGVSSG